ncbi:MAG: PilZ domain-containing protein [Pseudomonadota bacterium]
MKTRSSSRIRTVAKGSCKSPRGFSWDIDFNDLSEGGCRVDDPRHGMELGALVRLFIAGTGPHHAEVAWRQGDRVGLEFVKPLSQRVFTLLAHERWDEARAISHTEVTRYPVRRVM